MSGGFVHLHLHTEYSIVDGIVRIRALMRRLAAEGSPAVGLTDQNNLFALVKFYRRALAAGVKPVIGVDLALADPEDPDRPNRIVLLCRNLAGYRNLNRLLTRCYLEGQRNGRPMAERDWLGGEAAKGLIALSGGIEGDVGRALVHGREAAALKFLDFWRARFGEDYFLELTRTSRAGEAAHVAGAVALAARHGVGVVATNDVRFLAREDYEAHEARVCIHEGRRLTDEARPQRYSGEQYLKSAEEMAQLFADLPEALANSVEIARRASLDLPLGESFLPRFPLPAGKSAREHLREQAAAGLERRLAAAAPAAPAGDYRARLERELDVVCEMGFPGYFLIVADFIRWAREQQIPVGPGRGSGAGSLVAWALRITDLDPLAHDLLFERFLNPERVSMPDFDIDFCMEGRDRVIDYVAGHYGRERVSQIITYGTMAAKAVVRDVGRVLGHPYGFVDRIAKLIPFELGMTLERALEEEPELAALCDEDEEVRAIIELARSLEGLVRNAGKHAGGVVIAPRALTDFTPLYVEPGGGNPVTQLDKDDVEAAGLVKFDFLGLRTLTIIDWAVRIVNRSGGGEALDISRIPLDDPETYALLCRRQTVAVFQLESRGMRDLVKRLQPDKFEDLVALVALFRPGPLQSGMVDDFIARKHGRGGANDGGGAAIDYLHPDLEPVLEPTYGVILYQEQVMQIAQVLAGYTLGGADLLRRAMGKKKPEEMAKQREVFVGGARERGVPEATATRIFDLMEKFAGYGFNKSHSAAYALLSYQTAWLKAHHPAAFMAAVMSAEMDNTDKLNVLNADCRELGLEVRPPSVGESEYAFGVAGADRIRYGLGAVKGVGRGAVEAIVAARERGGAFASLADFCRRVDLERVSRRSLEALIKAGAFDELGAPRAALMSGLEEALRSGEQARHARAAGQNDMFGLPVEAAAAPAPRTADEPPAPAVPEWPERERLAAEKEALGLYLTGHPFREVAADARAFTTAPLGRLIAEPAPPKADGERSYAQRREVTVAGLVADLRKRGRRVTVVLDDATGQLETTLFAEVWQDFRKLLVKDRVVVVEGKLGYDDFIDGWRLTATEVRDIDEVIERRAERMVLRLAANGRDEALLNQLYDILMPYRSGPCGIAVQYRGASGSARLALGDDWRVRPTRDLRERLAALLGEDGVTLVYRH